MSGNIKGALFALLAFALYSAHDVIVKSLGGSYSTFQIIFFSGLFSFPLVFLLHLREKNADNLIPKHPWWTSLRVVTTVMTGLSAFYAFSTLPMAQVYAFLFGMPLVITVLAIPILGEKVGRHRWAAVIVGLIGVLIVLRPGSADLSLGHFAALTAAFCGAFSSLIVRKIGKDERTMVLLVYPIFGSLLLMGALMPMSYVPLGLIDLGLLAAMSVLAVLASLCIIAAYKVGEAGFVAPMHYSQMIWAVVYGFAFFDELPDQMTIIGSSVIIASGLYVVFRETRTSISKNTPVLRNRSRAETGVLPRVSLISSPAKQQD